MSKINILFVVFQVIIFSYGESLDYAFYCSRFYGESTMKYHRMRLRPFFCFVGRPILRESCVHGTPTPREREGAQCTVEDGLEVVLSQPTE